MQLLPMLIEAGTAGSGVLAGAAKGAMGGGPTSPGSSDGLGSLGASPDAEPSFGDRFKALAMKKMTSGGGAPQMPMNQVQPYQKRRVFDFS